MDTFTPQPSRGYAYALGTALCFAINTIGLRAIFEANPGLSPENAAIWGFIGALALVSTYYMTSSGARHRMVQTLQRDLKTILVISFLTVTGAALWVYAMKHAIAPAVSLLAKSMILYSAILGYFFLNERLRPIELLGFLIAIPGVILISTLEGEVAPGAAAAVLFSAFIYALQSFVVKKYAPKLSGLEFTIVRASVMLSIFLVLTAALGRFHTIPLLTILQLSTVTLTGLIIGRSFYFEAHKHLEISRLNMAMLIEPIIVLAASAIFLSDLFTLQKAAGAFLILFGLSIMINKNLNKNKNIKMDDNNDNIQQKGTQA